MPFKKRNDELKYNERVLNENQYEYSQAFLTRTRRMLFLRGPVLGSPARNDSSGPTWIGDDIMALALDEPTQPIYVIVDSGGGDIAAGLMLYDIIKMSPAPVTTVVMNAASMGTIIGAAGSRRLCLPHSRFMIHLPSAAFQGTEREIDIRSKLLTDLKNDLISCYIESGVTAGIANGKATEGAIRKKIIKDIEVEKWLNPGEAIAYGLIDAVISNEELFGIFACTHPRVFGQPCGECADGPA